MLAACRQFDDLAEMLGKAEAWPRVGLFAERARQVGGESGPDAPREPGARQGEHIGKRACAERGQTRLQAFAQGEHRQRQPAQLQRQCGGFAADKVHIACALCASGNARCGGFGSERQPLRGERRRRQRRLDLETLRQNLVDDARKQRLDAAEEAQRSRDFEQQRRRWRHADFGSETARPAGETSKRSSLLRRLARQRDEFRQACARTGQAKSGNDPGRLRRLVGDEHAIEFDDGARLRRPAGLRR